MKEWETAVGKWNDYDNYDLEEPAWRRVLELAKKYRDVSDVIEILQWIYNRNIENHAWNEYIAAYGLLAQTGCTEKELSDILFERGTQKVIEFSNTCDNIDEYAVRVFQSTGLPESVIDEFRARKNTY